MDGTTLLWPFVAYIDWMASMGVDPLISCVIWVVVPVALIGTFVMHGRP